MKEEKPVHPALAQYLLDSMPNSLSEKQPSAGVVDELSNFIRSIDGDNRMGAGVLAERICEWLAALNASRDAVTVPVSQQSEVVKVPVPFVRFLLGEETIEGYGFGDVRPDMPGMFWWRKQLRALLTNGGDV